MTTPALILQDPLAFTPAPRGSRVIAFAMDYLATVVVTSAVAGPLILAGDFSDTDGFRSPGASNLGVAAVFVIPFLSIVMNIVLMHTRGYTVGKRIMGLRVLSVETGAPLSWGRSIARVLVIFAPLVVGQVLANIVILLAPVIAGVIWIINISTARPPLKQTWQDLAAHSVVVTATVLPEPATTPGEWGTA